MSDTIMGAGSWWTPRETAEFLGVTVATLAKWRSLATHPRPPIRQIRPQRPLRPRSRPPLVPQPIETTNLHPHRRLHTTHHKEPNVNATDCDPNIDWTECDHCKEFRNTMDAITAVAEADRTLLDQAYSEYCAARDAGHVLFGTETHRAWLQRLDKLEQQLDEINVAKDTAIEQWAECIHTHHQLHENWKRNTTEASTETKEMEEVPTPTPLIRADKFMELIDSEQAAWESTIRICAMLGMDTSSMRGRLEAVRGIRAQFERLIDELKETHNASH